MTLQLAIWDSPAADFLVAGLAGSDLGIELVTAAPSETLQLLVSGQVDVALVPTLDVIRVAEGVEVLPAVALSTWHYPYARIHLPDGLVDSPESIACETENGQEALVARVVLREHYAMKPDFDGVDADELAGRRGARLLVGRNVPSMELKGTALDLGEEWFEMANYPMVWGVFAMRTGEADQDVADRLRLMVERSEALRPQWVESKDQAENIRRFFADDVRLRFDDLAVASITELIDHAFYHDLTDEIRDFPIARLDPDDVDEGEEEPFL